MKLNSDGSTLKNPGKAGGGGLFRDHEGKWVKGYARGIGHTNSFMAELWALRDSLILAREMGLNNLIIELDALSIVMLMNNEAENIMMEPLLSNCRNLMKQIPNKCVIHSYREANQCANALAKLEAQSFTHFVVFCNLPPVVETLLAFDKASKHCNRLVNS